MQIVGLVLYVSLVVLRFQGRLIQTAVGLAGGSGAFPTNRSGFKRKAWSSVLWRAAWTASACGRNGPDWGHQAEAGRVVLVVPGEEAAADVWAEGPKRLASWMQPKRLGKSGWSFRVLK
jgi:hypothetical protein